MVGKKPAAENLNRHDRRSLDDRWCAEKRGCRTEQNQVRAMLKTELPKDLARQDAVGSKPPSTRLRVSGGGGCCRANLSTGVGVPQINKINTGAPPVAHTACMCVCVYAPPGLGFERAGGRVVRLPGVVGENAVAGVEEGAVLAVQAVLPLELPVHSDAVVPQHGRATAATGGGAGAGATALLGAAAG